MSGSVPGSVLVVGRGLYALQLLRAYDNAGCQKVYLATSAQLDFARGSLSLTKSFLVAKPDSSKPETIRKFSNDIQRLGFELEVDLIVPAAEEGMFVSLLAPQWHANGLKAAVLACPFALMDQLHDKYRFQKMCEGRVKTPMSELATSHTEVKTCAETVAKVTGATRVVVKPVYTRGGRSMWILDAPFNVDSLKSVEITRANPLVVQQFIVGQEYSSYSVVSKGRILAHVCYKCDFQVKGFSTVRITMRKPAILDWVYKFVEDLDPQFSGQLGFDFIEATNGDIYALECNPRATNGISFFSCDKALSRGLCESQYSAATKPRVEIVASAASSADSPVSVSTPRPPPLPKSPSSSVFSPAVVLGDDVLEPREDVIVATILPALSLLKGNPRLFRTLKQAHADMEWPSDPLPLFVALVKSARLLATSTPKLMNGQRFADLAAQATEDELVKYNCLPPRELFAHSNEGRNPRNSSSTSSLSSWEKDSMEGLGPLRILVTGATGFLGSKLVLKLAESPQMTVIATGRNRKTFDQVMKGESRENVEFIPCDLADKSAVKSIVKQVDVVIHCAAKCSPWGHLEEFVRDNVEVTRFLLEACASSESSVTRFIHVSSPSIAFAVDENEPRLFVKESEPLPPASKQANLYALTKMQAEQVVQEFVESAKGKLNICTIRPRAIYGEGDRALFPRIVSRLRESRLPQIGDGNTVVDLTHVDNVVHALICAVKAPKEACAGQVYNITDCDPQRLWRVIDRICDSLEMPRPRIHVPRKVAYVMAHMMESIFSVLLQLGITEKEPLLTRYAVNVLSSSQTLDCSLAREMLGYSPVVKTEQGVKSFLDSIRLDEMRLPLKTTKPAAALMFIPAAKASFVVLLCTLIFNFAFPQMTWGYYLLATLLFASAQFVKAREMGSKLLQEESRRRRTRAQLAKSLDPANANASTNGEYIPEKGKRHRPWRNVSGLEEKFAEAVRAAPTLAISSAAKHLLLDLYGLFKQQKDGDCNVPAPSVVMKPRDFAKWKAWNDRRGMSAEEAKKRYVEVIEEGFDLVDEGCDPEADRAADMAFAKTKEKVLYQVRIDGVGRYLPERIVSSEEVEKMCGIEAGWSTKHNVGVRNRRWADISKGETNSFMAARAIEEACKNAGIAPSDLDLIINASASNERILPDGSCLVKRALNLESSGAACFSVHATCLSFVVAMDLAASMIHAGRYRRVAIVSSEISSVACNFAQPESALLLGDGAAACVLGASPRGTSSCIHRSHFENHCKGLDSATLRTGTLKHPKDAHTTAEDHLFDMNGPQIVEAIREVGMDFLEKVRPGLSARLPYDIDLVVPHQPSGTAMDMLVAHGWPRDQTINILGDLGNCVAASTGMALYEAIKTGRLQRGMKFLMCGTGGGITLGAIVVTY